MGYDFDFGLTIDFGWHIANASGIETRRLGVLATYGVDF